MRLVPKWEMMEIELITEGEFVNPFLEIEVRAEFFTEGIERTVDGFSYLENPFCTHERGKLELRHPFKLEGV